MSHISSIEKCPRCGLYKCANEYNSDTGDQLIYCSECGYTDETVCEERNVEAGMAVWTRTLITNPYGTFSVSNSGVGDFSGVLVTKDEYELLKKDIESGIIPVSATVCVSHYNKETKQIEKEYLLGNPQTSLETHDEQ